MTQKLFIFDLDGTVYLGNALIDGAKNTIDAIQKQGHKVCFLTNNSSVAAQDYYNKLNNLGITANIDQIVTSGTATISYLKQNHPNKKVYLLGTTKLQNEFIANDIILTDTYPDICVLSFDTTIDYNKITHFNYFLNKAAFYIATHPDKTCPHPEVYVPDIGSFISMFSTSSNRAPDIICGKPYAQMGKEITNKYNIAPQNTYMIGDRLSTDILFAKNCNFKSILVLSGETTKLHLKTSNIAPDVVLDSIKDMHTNIYE